jgi:hypothetical protein
MMRFSSVLLLGSMGLLFAGCSVNPTVAGTPQASPLVTVPKQTTTKQATEVATDSQKQVLKVGDISELKDDKTCDDVGETLVYAETKNFRVNVCANKTNRQTPAFMKIAKKDGSLKIEGKAQLGWREDAFVGIDEKYGYRLQMPSSREFYFSIASGKEFAEVWQHEHIQLYYAIKQFKRTNNLESLLIEASDLRSDESKRIEFIDYIFDNDKKLGVCQSSSSRSTMTQKKYLAMEIAKLSKLDSNKYFLTIDCNPGGNARHLSFLLITKSDSGYDFKLLNIPEIARDKHGRSLLGEDGYAILSDIPSNLIAARRTVFNLKERTFSTYMGKFSCGDFSKYKLDVDGEKLDLIEQRESKCDDSRYAVDPSLLLATSLKPSK